jgi:hypothetical protein
MGTVGREEGTLILSPQWTLFILSGFFDMPRPGIEPGPEVPETSVMSFSLPGLAVHQTTQLYQQYAADKATVIENMIVSETRRGFRASLGRGNPCTLVNN